MDLTDVKKEDANESGNTTTDVQMRYMAFQSNM